MRQRSSRTATSDTKRKIQLMKKDNALLRQQISQQTKAYNLTNSKSLSDRINKLNDVADDLTRSIQAKSRQLEEGLNQVEVLDAQLMDARIESGPRQSVVSDHSMVNHQIKTLEDKLDQTLKGFNTIVSENASLRKQIKKLRDQREIFNDIYKKMERELHQKKEEMAETIELSNAAYEERDEAASELKLMEEEREKIIDHYNQQLSELDDIIKTDERIQNTLRHQEKDRLSGTLSREEEEMLLRKIVRGNWLLAEQRAKHIIQKQKREKIESTFQHIEKECGVSIDELVESFKLSEDSNFSLFTFVNEQQSEIEKLENFIRSLDEEFSEFQQKNQAGGDSNPKPKVESYKVQIREENKKAEIYAEKIQAIRNTIQIITEKLMSLFDITGGKKEEIIEMFGMSDVNESNISLFVGMLEEKTLKIIQQITEKGTIKMGPRFATDTKGTLNIEPPTTGDSDEDNDDLIIPLTREELMDTGRLKA